MPLQAHPLLSLALALGRRLPDQKLDIRHIVASIRQYLYKTKLKKDFDRPFHRADLMSGKGGDGLRRMGQMIVKHENTVVFQGHEIHLQQQVGIEQSILHTFQNDHLGVRKKVFFEFHVIIFAIF